MKGTTSIIIGMLLAGSVTSCQSQKQIAAHRIVANPINLNYRFQPKDESRREAADPVLEYFKGYYYLFASIGSCLPPSPEDIGVPTIWRTGSIFLVQLFPHWKIMLLRFFR